MIQLSVCSGILSRKEVIRELQQDDVVTRDGARIAYVQEGELCAVCGAADTPPLMCGYGQCQYAPQEPPCKCHSGYKGPNCLAPVPKKPPETPKWTWGAMITLAAMLLVMGYALVRLHRKGKQRQKQYNQSVFEMLQAPDHFAGPDTGFIPRKTGTLPAMGPQSDKPGGSLLDSQVGVGTDGSIYEPKESYVTGGF